MTFDIAPHRPLYPFESHDFDRDGLRLHYLDEGRGDPVVMLHGNPTWSFYYRRLVLALRDRYRAIAPDHIGMGLSDKPGDDRYAYRLRSRVDDLDALLDRLQIKKNLTLVMHDWGGAIGMAYAVRHPDRIARLVITNTAAFFPPGGRKIPWQLRFTRDTLLGGLLVRGFNAFSALATSMAVQKKMTQEVKRAYRAPYDSWRNRIATLRFVQDIPMRPDDASYAIIEETAAGLGQFQSLPILICWGEKDFVFDRSYLEQWRRRFPEAETHAFADAGHFLLEDAGDRVIPIVKDFLDRHPIEDRGA